MCSSHVAGVEHDGTSMALSELQGWQEGQLRGSQCTCCPAPSHPLQSSRWLYEMLENPRSVFCFVMLIGCWALLSAEVCDEAVYTWEKVCEVHSQTLSKMWVWLGWRQQTSHSYSREKCSLLLSVAQEMLPAGGLSFSSHLSFLTTPVPLHPWINPFRGEDPCINTFHQSTWKREEQSVKFQEM